LIVPSPFCAPGPADPDDPYAGDEILDDPPGEPAADANDAPFRDAYQRAVRGRIPLDAPELLAVVRRRGLCVARSPATGQPIWEGVLVEDATSSEPGAPCPGSRPEAFSPHAPSDECLADIAEDRLPEIGIVAPDRVLGPMADERPERESLLVAAGVMAFSTFIEPRVRPVDRFYKEHGDHASQERLAVHAVDRAPACLWAAEGGRLVPLLPLPPAWVPEGDVLLAPRFEGSESKPPADGTYVARLHPVLRAGGGDAWIASLALRVQGPVDARRTTMRLRLEIWRERRRFPNLTWVGLLRHRAELLYRFAHESAWVALRGKGRYDPGRDAVPQSFP
jgi:hypothetical protein